MCLGTRAPGPGLGLPFPCTPALLLKGGQRKGAPPAPAPTHPLCRWSPGFQPHPALGRPPPSLGRAGFPWMAVAPAWGPPLPGGTPCVCKLDAMKFTQHTPNATRRVTRRLSAHCAVQPRLCPGPEHPRHRPPPGGRLVSTHAHAPLPAAAPPLSVSVALSLRTLPANGTPRHVPLGPCFCPGHEAGGHSPCRACRGSIPITRPLVPACWPRSLCSSPRGHVPRPQNGLCGPGCACPTPPHRLMEGTLPPLSGEEAEEPERLDGEVAGQGLGLSPQGGWGVSPPGAHLGPRVGSRAS